MFEHTTSEQAQEQSQEVSALERKPSRSGEIELQLAQEELAKRSEELKVVKIANTQGQSELVYMQRLVDDLKLRLDEATEVSLKDRIRANKMENASFTAAEDWKADLEAMEIQYQADIFRLQKANKEVKLECVAAKNARDEAMFGREVATKQVESLSIELERAKAAVAILSQETRKIYQAFDELAKQKADLTEAYAACHTAAQAGVAMVAEKEAELRKHIAALFQAKQQAEILRWELFESRQNEMKLCEMDNELLLLKEQLANAKELKHQHTEIVMESNVKLQEAYSEIQQAKLAETEAATLLTLVQIEAKENRQRWEMACAEVNTLTTNLESSKNTCRTQQMEIMKLQQRELSACAQAADSEAKLSGALEDLSKAIAEKQKKDETLKHLTRLLDDAKLESQILRQQIYESIFEAEIKAIAKEQKKDETLKHLTGLLDDAELESQILRQQIYEAISEAEIKAITKEQQKVEDLTHLLDDAELESQILRQQIYEAIFEAEIKAQEALFKNEAEVTEEIVLLQEVLKVAECITSEARVDLQENSNKLHLVREQAVSGEHNITEFASAGLGALNVKNGSFETVEVEDSPQDEHYLKQALAACQPAALRIAFDVEVAREQLETVRAEVKMLKAAACVSANEAKSAKQEREQAQMVMSAAREEILAERLAREEALTANGKLEKQILVEREQVRLAREVALTTNAKLEQLQRKLTQAPEDALGAVEKLHGKSRELSEAWELVEPGSEAMVTVKQEEYDALKLKVHEAKESNSLIETEMLSLKCLNQRLLAQLDATNMEIKALRISQQNTWQQYEKVQQGNMILEAEVQRLKGKGEQLKTWEIRHEAFGSDANALESPHLMSLERKLQHDSLPHSMYREFPLSQKEEEEESTEFLPLSTKKKKKALFLRIGTFITKKIN